jgi:putative heme iron utilization protein
MSDDLQDGPRAGQGRPQMPPPESVAPDARRIMRLADKVALATLDRDSGAPFLSLTGVATLVDGTPVLLLSGLSRHTRNLRADARASLLFDGTGDHANPLTEARVTVSGRIRPCAGDVETAAKRFLARHPKAFYAGFGDFGFHQLDIEDAHYVGGFGTALGVPPAVLRLALDDPAAWQAGEADILEHMNQQHPQAVEAIAVNLLKGKAGAWIMTGLDPEGCDLMLRKHRLRCSFEAPVASIGGMHNALVDIAKKARSA